MIFWVLWVIGIVITVITKCVIKKNLKPLTKNYYETIYPEVSDLERKTKIHLHILVIVCIILVGGIAVAKFVGTFYTYSFWVQIGVGIIPAVLTEVA